MESAPSSPKPSPLARPRETTATRDAELAPRLGRPQGEDPGTSRPSDGRQIEAYRQRVTHPRTLGKRELTHSVSANASSRQRGFCRSSLRRLTSAHTACENALASPLFMRSLSPCSCPVPCLAVFRRACPTGRSDARSLIQGRSRHRQPASCSRRAPANPLKSEDSLAYGWYVVSSGTAGRSTVLSASNAFPPAGTTWSSTVFTARARSSSEIWMGPRTSSGTLKLSRQLS